jgi:hypothetical protein
MHRVQRLFSSFPTGRSGIGLLLLRLAASFFLVMHSRSAFEGTWTSISIGVVAVASAVFLATGFLTPIAGVLGVVAALLGGGPVCGDMAIALSLVFLGPGAYSVDARLFGRREIVIARQK